MRHARTAFVLTLIGGAIAGLSGCQSSQSRTVATGPSAMIGAEAANAEVDWTAAHAGGTIVLGAGDSFGPALHQMYLARYEAGTSAVASVPDAE